MKTYYFLCFLLKSHIWENLCSWDMDQDVLSQSDCRIFNQPYLQNKSIKLPDILHVYTSSHIFSCSKILEWTWSKMGHRTQDPEIGYISSMNWWNELIFCVVVQIQESSKLFQWFLSGHGQKWAWSFSS